ncbi:MAG TPA: M56 family metallopeptidase [Steroidobacteraceae bacterium]|nr:M56 family metallopeptidase [Steroidobacteraceae bacterium]
MRQPIAYRHLLWIGYGLTITALLLPLIRLPASADLMPHTLQVWSAPSMRGGSPAVASISLSLAKGTAAALFAAGMLTLLIRLVLDASTIVRIVVGAQTWRRHRGIELLVSDRVRVPFSVWIPRGRIVVIPAALLLRYRELQMAIRHEMQHHRQHDTVWLYLYPLLKALFFWNPAAHVLARSIQELQEFACDAAVVRRRGISPRTYCRSLVWIAEQSMGSPPMRLSASMNGNSGRKLLQRRVGALLARPTHCLRSPWVLAMSVVAMMLMYIVAIASAVTIQDRRISLDGALQMAATTPAGGISIPVNEAVVAQLNRLLATPDGREYLRASLNRMREHEAMMTTKIAENDLPIDLLAVPLVESGYRNLEQGGNPRVGAGLWMFLGPTARRFALTVNAGQDDRLDPAVETAAALRMFTAQYSRYRDWGLALLAYNCGNRCVDEGVEETGARDVWRIVAKGYENDPDYVAQTMAAMLILRNPSALN